MTSLIVSKFGGSSVANAEQIIKVAGIIGSSSDRKIVIVSAPGKGKNDKEKITDHLINIATEGRHFHSQKKEISGNDSKNAVIDKFSSIIKDLGIEGDDIIENLKSDLDKNLPDKMKRDFYASRGEHYNSIVVSRYLNKSGLEAWTALPEDIGLVVSEDFGNAKVMPLSYKNMKKNLVTESKPGIAVVPGFYGITENGDVAVFSRGGSDLTGGEVAYAVDAALYENWTDTDGIYQVDPRIIPDSEVIPKLTYKEIRLLSAKGFNVFHYDAMIKCRKKEIPINIRNTNNPESEGTLIVSDRIPTETVVGIARLDNTAYLYLEKSGSGDTIGFLAKLLDIMKRFGIETYHYPTDRDDVSVIFNQHDLNGSENDLIDMINEELQPDVLEINHDLTILSPVGKGMKDHPGIIAEAAIAMKEKNISIEILDQGPAQYSFHFGIQNRYSDTAIRALYERLILNQG